MGKSGASTTSSKVVRAKGGAEKSDMVQPAGAEAEIPAGPAPNAAAGSAKQRKTPLNCGRYLSLLGENLEEEEKGVGFSNFDGPSFSDTQWNGFLDATAASKILLASKASALSDGERALKQGLVILDAHELEEGNLVLALGSIPGRLKELKTSDPLFDYDLCAFSVGHSSTVDESVALVLIFEGEIDLTIKEKKKRVFYGIKVGSPYKMIEACNQFVCPDGDLWKLLAERQDKRIAVAMETPSPPKGGEPPAGSPRKIFGKKRKRQEDEECQS